MQNESYDFCVIGGSLSGIYTASQLCQLYPTKSVLLLERADHLKHGGDDDIKIQNCHHRVHLVAQTLDLKGKEVNESPIFLMKNIMTKFDHPVLEKPLFKEEKEEKHSPILTRLKSTDLFVNHKTAIEYSKHVWNLIENICKRVIVASHEKKRVTAPWRNNQNLEPIENISKDFPILDMTFEDALLFLYQNDLFEEEHEKFFKEEFNLKKIIACSGLPYYFTNQCLFLSVAARIESLNPFKSFIYSENDVRGKMVTKMYEMHNTQKNCRVVLSAEVKGFSVVIDQNDEKNDLKCIEYQVNNENFKILTKILIIALPREPLARLGGWDHFLNNLSFSTPKSDFHPSRMTTKRIITCRIDAEFRYPQMKSWLRENKLLFHEMKPDKPSTEITKYFKSSSSLNETFTPPETPSITPSRRPNNTPACPPSWWPCMFMTFPTQKIRLKATSDPHDPECALLTFYIDVPEQANQWLNLQKVSSAPAVRTAITNLLHSLFPSSGFTPFPFWARVVPIYTTLWRNNPGLPTDFLGKLRNKHIFICGRDYSTRSQGHAEGSFHTGSLVLDSIRRLKDISF